MGILSHSQCHFNRHRVYYERWPHVVGWSRRTFFSFFNGNSWRPSAPPISRTMIFDILTITCLRDAGREHLPRLQLCGMI